MTQRITIEDDQTQVTASIVVEPGEGTPRITNLSLSTPNGVGIVPRHLLLLEQFGFVIPDRRQMELEEIRAVISADVADADGDLLTVSSAVAAAIEAADIDDPDSDDSFDPGRPIPAKKSAEAKPAKRHLIDQPVELARIARLFRMALARRAASQAAVRNGDKPLAGKASRPPEVTTSIPERGAGRSEAPRTDLAVSKPTDQHIVAAYNRFKGNSLNMAAYWDVSMDHVYRWVYRVRKQGMVPAAPPR